MQCNGFVRKHIILAMKIICEFSKTLSPQLFFITVVKGVNASWHPKNRFNHDVTLEQQLRY